MAATVGFAGIGFHSQPAVGKYAGVLGVTAFVTAVVAAETGLVAADLTAAAAAAAAEGTLGGSAAGALELLAEATGAVAVTVVVVADAGVEEGLVVVNIVVRGGLPTLEDVIAVPPDTVAAADGMAGFETTDDGPRCAREPGVELEVDGRVAEDVEELSAVAAPAVMMAAAVPIPSSIARAPTRPIAIE